MQFWIVLYNTPGKVQCALRDWATSATVPELWLLLLKVKNLFYSNLCVTIVCSIDFNDICHSHLVFTSTFSQAVEEGFCTSSWIPYNGHCFYLNRTNKSWSDAQTTCRKEGGDLVSIRNVEDQSFIISQLGYGM